MIFSIFSLLLVAPIYWFAEIQTAGGAGACAGREVSGQRVSKEEEREDSRVEEASSVDICQIIGL